MKVALVYDRINKWGGAERVLLALRQLFPEAPLFTSVYDNKKAAFAKDFRITTSFLQKFPYAKSFHEYYPLLMPIAFENFSFDEYDLVISVTSEAAKGIITKPSTLHISYCLTPTRYLWSGYNDYFVNPIFKAVTKPFVSYLQTWDRVASNRPDEIIAISKEVQSRINTYYGRDSEVIYPPVSLGFSKLASSVQLENQKLNAIQLDAKRLEYYLVVSRLVPYKRIDLAIEACNELGLSLKIIGTGTEEKKLNRLAGKTVEFLGNLTDEELIRYYKGCKALIFPGSEDFGISIVEAQSFGKPVIAYKKGGALETVVEGKTGEFFTPQTTKALIAVLQEFNTKNYKEKDCIINAEKFGFDKFKKRFMEFVGHSYKEFIQTL